jgi:hypothetical protein
MFSNLKGDFELRLPSSVTAIKDEAFAFCTGLKIVVLGDKVSSVGVSAFEGCSKLLSIDFPENIRTVNNKTFKDCSSLANVNLPKNIKAISNSAFSNCVSLTHIELPQGLTKIGTYAFSGCEKINNVKLPNSILTLGGYAFYECSELDNIVLSDNLEVLETSILRSTAVTSVVIPNKVTLLEDYVFQDCHQLEKVVFSQNLQKFEDLTFGTNPNLKIDLNNNKYLSIDNNEVVYSHDGKKLIIACRETTLTSFNVKEGVEHILDGLRNINADTISLPTTINKVDYFAFSHLGRDPKVMICNSITPPDIDTILMVSPGNYVGFNAFDDLRLEEIIVPKGSLDEYRSWRSFAKSVVEIK